ETATSALTTKMAGWSSIQLARDDSTPIGNAWDPHSVARLLDQNLVGFWRWWLVKNAIGRAADAFFSACNSDEGFRLVVIGSNVLVGDGPIGSKSVPIIRLEVIIGEAEGHSSVVVGSSPDD